MPRVNRTPPTPAPEIEVQRALSNPNITTSPSEPEFVNLSQRTKRPRSEFSPTNELLEFKEEVRTMLTKWNTNQEAVLQNFMSKIALDLADLKTQNENLQCIKKDFEDSANLMNEKYEEMKTRMQKLESERSEQRKYIGHLEKHLQDIQDNHRSSVIELRNILPKGKEDGNDLTKIVTDTCKVLNVKVRPEDLRDVYRIQSNQGLNKPIIAEFQSVKLKNTILQAARNFNKGKLATEKLNSEQIGLQGKCVPVFIADRLPATMRKIFYEARKFANTYNFQYCWTSNGKIFMRKKEGDKPILVNSEASLQAILHAKE